MVWGRIHPSCRVFVSYTCEAGCAHHWLAHAFVFVFQVDLTSSLYSSQHNTSTHNSLMLIEEKIYYHVQALVGEGFSSVNHAVEFL